ncbi:Ubiquitin-conjugating enzyme E2 O [Toxocara canis]|uniref:Ubiquitin-conjugating enzyme E2 O n=1 Tax=Toxocara canis TaxID=6265 RepID=A0A0B2VM05_TOXCA|nr:Ubiquitin-conjugating enzyme E2 O [Toxocara canis]
MDVDDLTTIVANRVEQDDTVIYLSKRAEAKLGVVTRVYRGTVEENEKWDQKLEQGEVLIDVFPGSMGSIGSIVRKESEVFIADRGFSLSESVVRVNNPKQVGFVRKIHVKADVIVLPERKIVAKNVDLTTAKFIEPFASGGQNFLLFDDWIGSVLKSVFELTIVFRNCYRCKIKDNVGSGVLYRRKDYGIGRQWVPGETVMVSTSYVISKKVEWETEVPPCLLKRKLRSFAHHTPFIIEKVSLHAVKVRWLTTPSASVTPPPERITKPDIDRVIKLDTLEYTQAVCGDRMKLKPDDAVTVMRKTEWEKILNDELMEKLPDEAFKGRHRRLKKLRSSCSSSSCSTSTQTSTHSAPAKKKPSTSSLAERNNHAADTSEAAHAAESECVIVNDGCSELPVMSQNMEQLVGQEEEEMLDRLLALINTRVDTHADSGQQQQQIQSKVESAEELKVGTEVEVTATTHKASPIAARLPTAKKSKSATFNIRQIRRNKVIKLDTLEYTQAVCGDRMKLKPDDAVTVMRKTEWEKILNDELMEKLPDEAFKGRHRRLKKLRSSCSSSSCSTSTQTSTHSAPAKKKPSTSSLAERNNHAADTSEAAHAAESECVIVNDGCSELPVMSQNMEQLVGQEEEEMLDRLLALINTRVDTHADSGQQQQQIQSKVESAEELKVGTEVEVTATTHKASPIAARLPTAKKSKSATFNIRQIRRNKQNRAMKRKAARPRIQLDMRNCLGGEFYGDVMRTFSTVDVVWMDGTIEKDIPGTELVPYELDLDHHDDVPGAIVARKICEEMEGEYGIVLSADAEKRLAMVQWYSYDWKRQGAEPVLAQNELCSLFDLMLHPNYQRFWWGSLCLRTSKESTDVRNLIGQLISTNDNGKNTVVWFNGITEDVWPVEITVLLTSEEMDAQLDEEDEGDTWNSVDSEDDLTDQINDDSTIASSGMAVLITERNSLMDKEPSVNARIVLPQELIQPRLGSVTRMQSRTTKSAQRLPSKSWLGSAQGRPLKLSEILTMLKSSQADYCEGCIDHEELLARIEYILISLKNSTRALHFQLVDFFFTYVEALEKDMHSLENKDEFIKRHVRLSFDHLVASLEKVIVLSPPPSPSPYLPPSSHPFPFPFLSSLAVEEEHSSAGMLFLEVLFEDWINKLRTTFQKIVETPASVEDFIVSPFFSASNMPHWLSGEVHSPWIITAKRTRTSVANRNSEQDLDDAEEHCVKPSKESKESGREGNTFSDIQVVDTSSSDRKKLLECRLEVDSFDFVDILMPQLESSWATLDHDLVKRAFDRFIGVLISTQCQEDDDEAGGSSMETDEGDSSNITATQKSSASEGREAVRVVPKFSDLSERDDKVAYSIASALSTFVSCLLYDIMCSAAENGLFNSYGHVETNFRMLFYYYYSVKSDELLEEQKGKSRICWDDVMERIIEKWYEASVQFTDLIRGRLKDHFVQMMAGLRRIHAESLRDVPNPLLINSVKKVETSKSQTSESNDAQKSAEFALSEESGKDAENQNQVTSTTAVEDSEDQNRRFSALEFDSEAPASHAYHSKATCGTRPFLRAVRKELDLLSKHLPDGIHVKAFEDRLDLLSFVIVGPKGTPFEDVPLFFDAYLPNSYPAEPPLVHYWAFSQEQLNPNLYQTGKVCVSLLGTWNGKGSEQWTSDSNLLQVFLSIQGLILVPEPYFNEAGYESRKNLPVAIERSRRYNEMALVNSLDYFYRIMRNPPKGFEKLIKEHCHRALPALKERISAWESGSVEPDFPLTPISEGCRLSLKKTAILLSTMEEASNQKDDGCADSTGATSSSI